MTEHFSVAVSFERALEDILARVCTSGSPSSPIPSGAQAVLPRIAVAYSGGLDSSVLLQLTQHYASQRDMQVFAFHIHHGISPNADAWLEHCRNEASCLGASFDARQVQLEGMDSSGIEEAARNSRYAALGELCRQHQIPLLLTAHHQDDQAETVLLQLMRGSGVAGLSGMDRLNSAPDLLKDAALLMARPLLGVTRNDLEHYARSNAIAYVTDESNTDPRYTRNALRHQVMPILATCFPGFQERVVRTARHMQSAQRLLDELAQADLLRCSEEACLDIAKMRQLSEDRMDNLLRYWLGMRGIRMPSTAWLVEMRTQLLQAKADAQLCVVHPDCAIRRYRGRVYLTPKWEQELENALPVAFRWQGESQMDFPAYHGTLYFEQAQQGIDADWLRDQTLELRYRQGGEKLKLAANRSTRSLKHHYQELAIPPWERLFLPLVTAPGQILYVAGLGMDCHHVSTGKQSHIVLRWSPHLPGK